MKAGVLDRGDIVRMPFNPALGTEQQGYRPAIVLTPASINQLGLIGVCPIPITQGGQYGRHIGMAVSLTGAGTETTGIVLVQQFRMVDLKARTMQFFEKAPALITEEIRARVAALLD